MKYCSKCGKELMDEAVVCVGCGCPVQGQPKVQTASLDDTVKGAATTNLIAGIVLALGAFCAWFVNVWIGVVLCLVAELVALAPNSKLQKALKTQYQGMSKPDFKAACKNCTKDMKARYAAFRFSMVLGYISLAFLIVFVVLGNMLGL